MEGKEKQTLSRTSPSGISSSELVVSTVFRSNVASRVQSTASPSSGPLMVTLFSEKLDGEREKRVFEFDEVREGKTKKKERR